MSASIPGAVLDLKYVDDAGDDVAADLKLGAPNSAKHKTLFLIAENGGEIRWDWNMVKPATRELVADLIESGLVIEREYVTSALQMNGTLTLKLTDKGRNVVGKLERTKVVASESRIIQ